MSSTPNTDVPVPLLHSTKDARLMLGRIGQTKLWEIMAAGLLDARKIGNRTVITDESLRNYLARLPKADLRTGQRLSMSEVRTTGIARPTTNSPLRQE